VPEVAPGGNGTRFCGEYRVASAGRGAAVPVRRQAGSVGSCLPAAGRDGGVAEVVLAAAGQVPCVRPDACAAACGVVVAAPLRGRGDHGGAGAGSAGRGGGRGSGAPVRGGARGTAEGAGIDGPVVAVAVRGRGRNAAGAADAAAPAGTGDGGSEAAGAVGVAGRGLPGGAGGGGGRAAGAVPGAGRGVGARGGRAPVRGPVAGAGGAGPSVQHDPVSGGRRVAFVIMPAGAWSGYPVMNRAFSWRQS